MDNGRGVDRVTPGVCLLLHMTAAEKVLADLTRAGKARVEAEQARREATATIAGLLPHARREGVTVARIMEATGMSRKGVYLLLDREAGA